MAVLIGLATWAPLAHASGETITANDTATTELKQATAIPGIVINGTGNATVPVKLRVSQGTLAMSTTTGLTFTGGSTGSTLYFSGLRSDVNTALATLAYTRNTTGTDALEISLVNSGEVFFEDTGHLYEYVSSTLDWNAAKTAAEGRTKYGATGYLTTITSQAENDFVSQRLANAGWMGASDIASEGAWKWVTGPEAGTQFCQGNNPCNSVSSRYTNWNGGEPNDSGANEDCGQFLAGGSGKWNDLPCSGTTLPGYVVEYGAPGNMPAVAAKTVALTTSDTTAPTTPGAPSTTTPTTTKRPVWSWSASTDAGVGLHGSTPYALDWSQSSTFASGVTSGTSTTNSFTQPTNLADGTWYFRVRAQDASGNYSAYSVNGSVLIDSTGPSQPGASSTTVTTNDNTPTFDWSASTDAGVGLANPIYTVQWATNSGFSSPQSATTNAVSYTPTTLTDGTWYFRVKAADQLGNVSSWSNTATYLVDTQLPTTPSSVNAASPTNDSTPTLSWTASTESGSGLADPAYTIQWSQDSTFAGGITASTTNATNFTVPTLADGTWYFRVRSTDNAANSSAYTTPIAIAVDTTPPIITNTGEDAIGSVTTTIVWNTDENASSQIAFGPTTGYGSLTTLADTAPRVTFHTVLLSGLVACTLYHYQVISVDGTTNQATGADKSFITAGCAGSSDVIKHTESQVDKTIGGSLTLTQGTDSVSLQIPMWFSTNNADFQIKQLDSDTAFAAIGLPQGLTSAGAVYDFKAMRSTTVPITTFDQPIKVTMHYTDDTLTTLVEHSLTIYRWDSGNGWQELQNCEIDTVKQEVSCWTSHFSTFGLFGTALPVAISNGIQQAAPDEDSEQTTAEPTPISANTTKDGDTNHTVTLAKENQKSDHTMVAWLAGLFVVTILGFIWWVVVARRRKKDQDEQ